MKRSGGSVLVVVLWAVIFFAMTAAYLGARTRSQLNGIARFSHPAQLKAAAYEGLLRVKDCLAKEDLSCANEAAPGLFDEQSRININTASEHVFLMLYLFTDELNEEKAKELAKATVEWRKRKEPFKEFGQTLGVSGTGFGSVQELLTVPGMTEKIWKKLEGDLTVHGAGDTNLNSISKETLTHLGISVSLAERIMEHRAQHSKFLDLGDLTQKIGTNPEENAQLQNLSDLWTFDSDTFHFTSSASFGHASSRTASIECVMSKKGHILYMKDI